MFVNVILATLDSIVLHLNALIGAMTVDIVQMALVFVDHDSLDQLVKMKPVLVTAISVDHVLKVFVTVVLDLLEMIVL